MAGVVEASRELAEKLARDGIPRPVVDDRADIMDDPQAGRVAATHFIGARVEDMLKEQEGACLELEHLQKGLIVAGKALEEHREGVKARAREGQIHLKESEYGVKYVHECVVLLQRMYAEAEAKRLLAEGARVALANAVQVVNVIYKDEREKLRRQEEYLVSRHFADRPVGVHPGNPLELYKADAEAVAQAAGQVTPPKRRSRKAKTDVPSDT